MFAKGRCRLWKTHLETTVTGITASQDPTVEAPRIAPDVRVGFILSPRFTMLPFAGFLDLLRHAADEGDRSRQIYCTWEIVAPTLDPVVSSPTSAVSRRKSLIAGA